MFLVLICRCLPPQLHSRPVTVELGTFSFKCSLTLLCFSAPVFTCPPSHRSLSFSYGRALQQSTLKAWQGKAENLEAAQTQLKARAQANSEANLGKYVAGSQPSADETLFVKGYKY